MTPYQKRVTAFTQRMAEDMQLRNLSPRTIDAYTIPLRFSRDRSRFVILLSSEFEVDQCPKMLNVNTRIAPDG